MEIGKQEGAKLLAGGYILRWRVAKVLLCTNIIYGCTFYSESLKKKFSDRVSLIPVKSFEEAIEVIIVSYYGLSSSIFSRDVNRVFTAA